MRYLIDSNCFIEPKNTVCPLDVATSFWSKIKSLADEGDIFILDKVKAELSEVEDELKDWVNSNIDKNQVLKFENERSIAQFRLVNAWALTNKQYNQNAINKFLDSTRADIFLVSYAATLPSEWTVVSQEKSSPQKQNDIKLPDACTHFGVRCVSLMDMFREMGETY